MKYRCPYCKQLFGDTDKHICPLCRRAVLLPGFFRKAPRPADESAGTAAPRRKPRTASPLALFGNSGFKVGALLLLMMMVGVALVNKVKAPPPNSDARKIDRSRLSLANLRVALEIYKDDCGSYPAAGEGLAALVHPPVQDSGWKGPYIYDLKNDLWGSPFQYALAETNVTLFGCGPDRQAGTADDITVERADIALNQSQGTVYAVVVFDDGTRKVVREQVKMDPGVRASLLPAPGG